MWGGQLDGGMGGGSRVWWAQTIKANVLICIVCTGVSDWPNAKTCYGSWEKALYHLEEHIGTAMFTKNSHRKRIQNKQTRIRGMLGLMNDTLFTTI